MVEMRRVAALLVLASWGLAGPVLAPARGAESLPRFATVLVAAPGTGEPAIAYDAGRSWTYIDGVGGSARVWRKYGAGRWEFASALDGGGDADLAVDADGVVYVADLEDPGGWLGVAVSHDHAATFQYKTVVIPGSGGLFSSSGGIWDRQWLAAWGHGNVVATAGYYDSASSSGEVEHSWVSADAGRTFRGPYTVTPLVDVAGKLARSPSGILYMPYIASDAVGVASSADGGRSWQQHAVAPNHGTSSLPSLAVDDAGAAYLAWVDAHNVPAVLTGVTLGGVVRVAYSRDQGARWSEPVTVSDPSRTAVFPWIVAGAPGRVDVVYYADRNPANADTGPDLGTPLTQWDVEVAQSLDASGALGARPRWQRTVAVAGVHTGAVCTEGIGCLSPQNLGLVNVPFPFDRRLLDFFGAALGPDGRLIFSYPTDHPVSGVSSLLLSEVDIRAATQIAGPTLR